METFPGKVIDNGNEIIYSNTDMENYLGTIEFDYEGDHIVIGDGCEYPIWLNPPQIRPPRGTQYSKFISHFLKDGDFDGLTAQNLQDGKYWTIAPWPDLNATHSTGSSRIFCTSIPGILQFYKNWYTGEEIPESFRDRVLDHIRFQSLRSDGKGEWSLNKYPDSMWGGGYGKGGGPGRMLYSASNPLGRPEGELSDGFNFVDYLHFQITPLIHCALLTRSLAAARSCIGAVEVNHAYFRKGSGLDAPRCWAGHIQALAHMIAARIGPVATWYKYLLEVLEKLESRNVDYDGRVASMLDYAKQADHMNVSEDMAEYLTELGIPEEEHKPYAQSWSTWMGGWKINAQIDVLELVPMPLEYYKRWNKQLKLDLSITALALRDKDALDWKLGERNLQWIADEYAPKHPFTKNAGHNTVVGVQVRFLLPALERALSRGYDVRDLVDSILDYCDEQHHWNTSDLDKAQLSHLWPTTGRRGWK